MLAYDDALAEVEVKVKGSTARILPAVAGAVVNTNKTTTTILNSSLTPLSLSSLMRNNDSSKSSGTSMTMSGLGSVIVRRPLRASCWA